MPDLDWHRKVWGKTYPWPKDGDEWDEMAKFSGVSYESWKDSLIRLFVINHLRPFFNVVEIGAGHGRWSERIAPQVPNGTLCLVDLNQACIDYCRKRLEKYQNIKYVVNDGSTLKALDAGKTDFVWSFDTFPHIEIQEVRPYAREIYRIMARQSMGAIHHCGNPTAEQKASGARASVTGVEFKKLLMDAGFYIIHQVDSWNGGNVKLQNDLITVFVKP